MTNKCMNLNYIIRGLIQLNKDINFLYLQLNEIKENRLYQAEVGTSKFVFHVIDKWINVFSKGRS